MSAAAIDLDAFAAELHQAARRLHTTAGRWDGTGAGRSSGLLLALSVLQRHREEAERHHDPTPLRQERK